MKQMSIFDMVPEPSRTPPPPAPAAAPPAPIAADAVEPATMTDSCELELVLHHHDEVRRELLVSVSGHEAEAVWLQTAQVEFTDTGRKAPATTTRGKKLNGGLPVVAVNLPVEIARQKGLL